MHNYMIIRSLNKRYFFIEERVSIQVGFVRPSGQEVIIDRLDDTTLTKHDVEHLAWGVGYTLAEETLTGHYLGLAKGTLLELLGFSRKQERTFHVRAFGRDLTEFGQLMAKINKEGGDYRLDLYGADLIITKI